MKLSDRQHPCKVKDAATNHESYKKNYIYVLSAKKNIASLLCQ